MYPLSMLILVLCQYFFPYLFHPFIDCFRSDILKVEFSNLRIRKRQGDKNEMNIHVRKAGIKPIAR